MQISSILESVRLHAEQQPERPALGDKTRLVNYGTLWEEIQRGADYLWEAGVRTGDMVVIRGAQKVEFMTAMLALHLLGAAACPMEKAVRDDRILEIMQFVDSGTCIAEKPVAQENVRNISLKTFAKESRNADRALWPADTMPAADRVSEILFTTGTTGKSKGIEVTFLCNVYIAQNVMDSVSMGPDEVELITSPINHSLALRRTYAALYNGSAAVLIEGFKFASTFYQIMDTYHITGITFVPAILEQVLLYDADRFATYDKDLHYIQLGSAPLSESNKKKLCQMFPHVRLYNTYGATESGCTVILEFSKYHEKVGCIGRTTVNTEILYVDDQRQPFAATKENPGSLAFRGGMNMKGYYKEPEITAEVLDEQGIIYTNDVGYPGEDGLVYLIGRKGDVINMGGIKIAPTEIEEVAQSFPAIRDCACIPVSDPITGEAPLLFVALKEGAAWEPVELTKFLESKLERLKVPKRFRLIDEIPRTFNGKIIRRELKAIASEE